MTIRLTVFTAAALLSAAPLSAQEFAELAAHCAPGVAPQTLAAIARVESGFSPLAIHDNTSSRSYKPQDKAEALQIARHLLGKGHSVDLGLMQVNNQNFAWTGLALEDAFEPCQSIKAGAAVLVAFSRYNTGSSKAGFSNGYVARIAKAAMELREGTPEKLPETAQVQPASHDWDVFPDDSDERQQPAAAPPPDAAPTAPDQNTSPASVPSPEAPQ